ncbi:DUF7544 domain-containing protein [Salinibaculum rarum]|uniref:DUF7544 domain-containing protein n=1 Tax=Salinibaculum rarum TaxID=3058903 RepID=UPI0026601EEA|nr:hypothetical protein [Salinibaculum sp. KK48]
MGYAALSCLGDALDATEEFLRPVDRGLWLRLAVVVFFLSGGSGVGSLPNLSWQFPAGGFGEMPGTVPAGGLPVAQFDEFLPLVVGIAAAFALAGLLFTMAGAVMEFVLVDALRRESVSVRAMFREHLRKGLALFGFYLVVALVTAGPVAGLGVLFVLPALDAGGAALAVGVLVTGLAALVGGLLGALAYVFTVAFVVPTMLAEDRGLRSAWGRFWAVLWDNPGEFLVYLGIRVALLIAVGIVAGVVVGIAGAVLVIPFGIVAGVVFLAGGATLSTVTVLVLGVVAVLYVLVLLAVVALVQVPLKTFTRYYELLVLGDIDPELDLVSERREALRSGSL